MLSYGKCLIRVTAVSGADAYCWSFVNNNDTLTVTKTVDLLCVGVVAGAKRIGMDPVQEIDILYIEAEIQSSSAEKGILMLAEALEIKRFTVDQKLRSLHFYGSETEFFCIVVISVMNFRLVQVRSAGIRLPEMDLWDPEFSFSPGAFRFAATFCIYDF